MPHDKIKAAARERMTRTGEPYAAARRAAVTEHRSAEGQSSPENAGYLLRMSGEIHDWLADLRDSNPAVARYVVQALATLMWEGAGLGEPLVVSTAESWPQALLDALDRSYDEDLERVQDLFRRELDAGSLAKDLKDQLGELTSQQAKLEDLHRRALDAGRPERAAQVADTLAALQRQAADVLRMLNEAAETRRRLEEQCWRARTRVDVARNRTIFLRASYSAAHSGLLADETLADPERAVDDSQQHDDGGEAIRAGRAMVRDLIAQMERELDQQPWPEGLMELRPGAPDGTEIRILFGVEPPGTALLIAVVEGAEAVADQHLEAVLLSAQMLHRVRAGQAPEATAHGYEDTRSFLAEFYPSEADVAGP